MCTLQLGHQESISLQKPYKQLIHTVLCCSTYFLLPFHICTHANSVIHASTHCYVHTCVHVHAHTHAHTCTLIMCTLIMCTLTYSSDSVSSTGEENPCDLFSQCHRHRCCPSQDLPGVWGWWSSCQNRHGGTFLAWRSGERLDNSSS